MKTGVELIAQERIRQLKELGYTLEHDEKWYKDNQLAKAAACYTLTPTLYNDHRTGLGTPKIWPWDEKHWKPTPDDRVRELTKAGALIAAEIDRLQRSEKTFKYGDLFTHRLTGVRYQIVWLGDKVVLVNLKTGMALRGPLEVEDTNHITEDELRQIGMGVEVECLIKNLDK